MVHASLRIKFAPDRLAEGREILCATVERTRVSPGCLGCDVYEDLLDSGTLMIEAWWKTHDDLDRHLRSDLYRRVILVIEMGIEYPVMRFGEITRITGMERLKNSRYGLSPGHQS
jgi:quinol monooxygenase YgiN